MFPEGEPASTSEPALNMAENNIGILVLSHHDFLALDKTDVQNLAIDHPLVIAGVPLQNSWDWTEETFRRILPPFTTFQGHSKLSCLSIILSS